MLKSNRCFLSAAIICSVLFILCGCSGRSPEPRLYMLTPVSAVEREQVSSKTDAKISVGIGPIEIADYLNQKNIITRTNDNTINQANYDQWSGSLKDNLITVFSENIGYLLKIDSIFVYPWRTFIPIDYQVTMDIIRFDGRLGKDVVLVARWNLLKGKEKDITVTKRSEIRIQTSAGSYEALVKTLSKALSMLSTEIVNTIQDAEN